jgi:hypothetical protein
MVQRACCLLETSRLMWLRMALSMLLISIQGQCKAIEASCRMPEGARHEGCALPYELGNFQGYYRCDEEVLVGRPVNLDEAQAIVVSYSNVKASGVGHSWWKEQFCSGNTSDSVNLVMTELNSTLSLCVSLHA